MRLVLGLAVQLLTGSAPDQGAITGTVRDADRSTPLVGVTVALDGLPRAAITDQLGRYRLDAVPAGRRRLTVRRVGYDSRSFDVLVPGRGSVEINLTLDAAPYHLAPILVRRSANPPPSTLAGDDRWPGRRVLTVSSGRDDPLVAEPDLLQALRGRGVVLDPETPQGVHLDGGASDQTGYLLDGIPVFNPYHAAGLFSAWNPDALEQVALVSTLAEAGVPATLSGTIQATSRRPGERLRWAGAMSTTQARLTLDGPLAGKVGLLVSVRQGFPGLFSPGEPSYLRGGANDVLAKVETGLLGGRLGALVWRNDNEVGAASAPPPESGEPVAAGHEFEWQSQSLGFRWLKTGPALSARVIGWSASGTAEASWNGAPASLLAARRHDYGLSAVVERRGAEGLSIAGLSLERSSTRYLLDSDSAALDREARARIPTVTLVVEHRIGLGRLAVGAGGQAVAGLGRVRLAPQGRLHWTPVGGFGAWVTHARRFQLVQSLRNPESVVGGIFPADLYLGAGSAGVPVARSDQTAIGLSLERGSRFRGDARLYRKTFDGVLLIAPVEAGPFAVSSIGSGGGGSARGLSLSLGWTTPALELAASYDRQSVRYGSEDAGFVPGHAAAHLAAGGIVVRPSGSWSLRLGTLAVFGRRSTGSVGATEWEACNLLDRGCEFAGAPELANEGVGSRPLPGYVRLDLGVRKEWTLRWRGGPTRLGAFGTVTNLLGRVNLQSYLVDPATGQVTGLEMRPRAPLVVGLDWRP